MRPGSRGGPPNSARGPGTGAFAAAGSNLVRSANPTPRTGNQYGLKAAPSVGAAAGAAAGIDRKSLPSTSLVKALKNTPVNHSANEAGRGSLRGSVPGSGGAVGLAKASPQASEGGSSDDERSSVCSARSDMSSMSALSASAGGGKRSGTRSHKGSKNYHMSWDGCAMEIEAEETMKMSLLTDFAQLNDEGGKVDGLLQCLQMYGYTTPNKLQQRVIPAILHFMGRDLGGQATIGGKGKSCITLQGPCQAGKTSAVVMALLASIDPETAAPQAIILSGGAKMDVEKYLRVFTLMQSVMYVSFNKEDGDTTWGEEFDDNSPEVKAAQTAHILVGHPRRILKLLSSCRSLNLDAVRLVILDDADELLFSGLAGTSGVPPEASRAEPTTASENLRLVGLPQPNGGTMSTAGASVASATPATLDSRIDRRASSGSEGNQSKDSKDSGHASHPSPSRVASRSPDVKDDRKQDVKASSPIEDIVQINSVIDCRQYSQNMADTYKIRSGATGAFQVRHVLVSQELKDPATKKAVRLLKSSLMKKKNMAAESCAPPAKLMKSMKHYYAAAPKAGWSKVFAGLVQSLMFPRAVIFCDDEDIGQFFHALQELSIPVSGNVFPAAAKERESQADVRRRAVQEFTSGKSQFLITPSEPAICQIMLPKVSCVFHFGLPSHMPSAYGVRLMPIDAKVMKDSSSILLVDSAAKGTTSGAMPTLVSKLSSIFDISFMDMPWEYLPQCAGLAKK